MSRKIVKNNFLANLAKKVEDTKSEEQKIIEVLSNFDYKKNEFTEAEKRFVQERERTLVIECKKNRDSLYTICMTLQEVYDFFKNNKEIKFVAWYEAAGFNKDSISRYLKRASLYLEFADKKDLISSMSNQVVKLITSSKVEEQLRKDIISIGCTAVKDIRGIIKVPTLVPMKNCKYLNLDPINKIIKNIKNMGAKDILETKKEIENFKKFLREAEKDLEQKEVEFENENNFKLLD
ncbi:MAG: hypothetical protein ACRC6U_09135 [Fusobacteriaceae bacterium]